MEAIEVMNVQRGMPALKYAKALELSAFDHV